MWGESGMWEKSGETRETGLRFSDNCRAPKETKHAKKKYLYHPKIVDHGGGGKKGGGGGATRW